MNLLRGKISSDGARFELGNGAIALPGTPAALRGAECILGVRPEHLALGKPGVMLQVEMVEALGADVLVHGMAGGQPVVIRAPAGIQAAAGQTVEAGFDAVSLHWFDPQTSRRIDA